MTGPNSPHPFFPRKKPPKFLPFLPFLPFLTNLGYLHQFLFSPFKFSPFFHDINHENGQHGFGSTARCFFGHGLHAPRYTVMRGLCIYEPPVFFFGSLAPQNLTPQRSSNIRGFFTGGWGGVSPPPTIFFAAFGGVKIKFFFGNKKKILMVFSYSPPDTFLAPQEPSKGVRGWACFPRI